jgi:hypothetical protein
MGQATRKWWRASAMLLLLGTGCETTNPFTWNWQTHNAKPEEYRAPPVADSRYSEPQAFPKYLVTPNLKKSDNDLQKPPPAFGSPNGVSAAGNFAQ